ncbi:MAG TPA: hypothetical protein PLX97_09295 [Gemmatales bacterium]|nr:hypothetical protein [Gemmatales bacterium]
MVERRTPWQFIIVSAIAGFLFWWSTDWWCYVEDSRGRWPKFMTPWWGQVALSGTVGALAGGVWMGVASVWQRLTR